MTRLATLRGCAPLSGPAFSVTGAAAGDRGRTGAAALGGVAGVAAFPAKGTGPSTGSPAARAQLNEYVHVQMQDIDPRFGHHARKPPA